MKHLLRALLIALAAAAPVAARAQSAASAPEAGWVRYENARFGTRIDYPAALFQALPPPENGDGQAFESRDGTAGFVVFGQANYDDLDPKGLMLRDIALAQYDRVTYQKIGPDWYVISGFSGPDIFYRRVQSDRYSGVIHVFELTYPATARDPYDALAGPMAASLGHD